MGLFPLWGVGMLFVKVFMCVPPKMILASEKFENKKYPGHKPRANKRGALQRQLLSSGLYRRPRNLTVVSRG